MAGIWIRARQLLLFFFFFLGLYPQHMEVTMLGVESQLQLPAYATAYATATQDLSHITAMTDP